MYIDIEVHAAKALPRCGLHELNDTSAQLQRLTGGCVAVVILAGDQCLSVKCVTRCALVHPCRGLLDPLFLDSDFCWNAIVSAGMRAGSVHLNRRPRCVETGPYVQRYAPPSARLQRPV